MNLPALRKKLASAGRYLLNSTTAGIPLEVFLILTDECNYRCKVCSLWKGIYKDYDSTPMSLGEIKSMIDQASSLGIPAMIISGGEPLLRPDILEIAEYASQRIDNVRINTNASLLTDDMAEAFVEMKLDEIWISLDGVGEYFDDFRGVENAYARTTEGLKKIRQARRGHSSSKPKILIDTIATHENMKSLPDCAKTFIELGADELNFVHACYVPPGAVSATEKILDADNIYSGQFTTEAGKSAAGARMPAAIADEVRAICRGKAGLFIDPLLLAPPGENRPPVRCLFPWTNIMIFSNGDACACPLIDYVTIGNLRTQSIMEVWNGPKMRDMRARANKGFPVCEHCICSRRVPADHIRHRQTLPRIFGS